MEQLFSQYGRIITSRILVDQVTGIALFYCWAVTHSPAWTLSTLNRRKPVGSVSLWCQGSNIALFSYSEQAYHEEWASSGLTSETRQRKPSKVWMDRSLWVPPSPSLSSSPTTPARRQARPYWLSCTRLLHAATRGPCTTRRSASGTEPSPTSHNLVGPSLTNRCRSDTMFQDRTTGRSSVLPFSSQTSLLKKKKGNSIYTWKSVCRSQRVPTAYLNKVVK